MRCPECKRDVLLGWVSCAHCGRRLDDPGRQGDICIDDEHEFVIEGPHCVRCGFHPDLGDRGEQIVRNSGFAVLAMVCFLVALGAGIALQSAENKYSGRFFAMVASAGVVGMGFGIFMMRRVR